jgi:oligopeptide transport system ATP-binding protein
MEMYLGRAVEVAGKHHLYSQPKHPYTQALLSAIPQPDPRRERGKSIELLHGDVPSPISPPSGCTFRTRCPRAQAGCAEQTPVLQSTGEHSQAACLRL